MVRDNIKKLKNIWKLHNKQQQMDWNEGKSDIAIISWFTLSDKPARYL